MNYKGMVVIENEDFGEGVELVQCIAKKAKQLVKVLSNAQMAERDHKHDDDYDDDDDFDPEEIMYRKGRGRGRGSMKGGGRYGY